MGGMIGVEEIHLVIGAVSEEEEVALVATEEAALVAIEEAAALVIEAVTADGTLSNDHGRLMSFKGSGLYKS